MKKYRPQLFFAGAVVIGLITAMLVMGWLRDADLRHVAEARSAGSHNEWTSQHP